MSSFYNFDRFISIMSNIKQKATPSVLNDLKNELNKFFKESKCTEVIYTNNTDKLFFGMCVIPSLPTNNSYLNSVREGKVIRFESYILELDSKLFSPMLGLTSRELTAILLHEVGHIVNNTAASRVLCDNFNYHIAKEGISITYSEVNDNMPLFDLAILKALRNVTSIFEKNAEEYKADEFVVACGFGKDLDSAFSKILATKGKINSDVKKNKFLVLIWTLSVFKDIKHRRTQIIRTMEDAKLAEGSELFKRRYDNVIKFMKSYTFRKCEDGSVAAFTELTGIASEFIKKLKFSSLKSLEDDFYEFQIRISNIDDQVEAMDILRSINMRISLIEEYIQQEGEAISKSDQDKMKTLLSKYKTMREELVKKGNYDKGMYGLFVRYPEINSKRMI